MSIMIGVVEDSEEDFAALSRVVKRSNLDIELERWHRAEDLLHEAHSEPARVTWPDLLFIDLSLPGIDGSALVTKLRSLISTKPLPLFVLSGSTRRQDIDRSYEAGASLYLVKPLDSTHIQAAADLLTATPSRGDR